LVVLAFNQREQIVRKLRYLYDSLPGVPIIFVDNGSTDASADVVEQHLPGIHVMRAPINLGAGGRNVGVYACTTPYVAFCDDDVWWEAGTLAHAEALDRRPGIGALNPRLLVGQHEYTNPACDVMACSPLGESAGSLPLQLNLVGASVLRVEAFKSAGGYDDRFFVDADDHTLLCLDLVSKGWQVVYADTITARQLPPAQDGADSSIWRLARNAIWTAWMRLPLSSAWRETMHQLSRAWHDDSLFCVLYCSAAGLPWALRQRQVVPRRVSAMWRQWHASR
jgi:GT2 family glycosyltransferase